MLLCGEENLREVVLCPMNERAEDLMMGVPSEVSPRQLGELHIRVVRSGWKRQCRAWRGSRSLCRARPILFVLPAS